MSADATTDQDAAQVDTNAAAEGGEQQAEAPELKVGEGPEGGEATPENPPAEPIEYQDFSVPEGIQADSQLLEAFTDTAKEMGLSQENAQKLVDMGGSLAQKVYERYVAEYAAVRENWVKELKADPTFGGNAFEGTCIRAQRIVKKYGSPELTSYLNASGIGDNPEVVKFLARIDRATGEDSTVDGDAGAPAKDPADILYPEHGKT